MRTSLLSNQYNRSLLSFINYITSIAIALFFFIFSISFSHSVCVSNVYILLHIYLIKSYLYNANLHEIGAQIYRHHSKALYKRNKIKFYVTSLTKIQKLFLNGLITSMNYVLA